MKHTVILSFSVILWLGASGIAQDKADSTGRFYLTNSPRLFMEGNLYGMYLFGYGNFLSTADDIGFQITKHLSVNAGYQLGSRLIVNNKNNDRIGIHLTQSGAIFGMQASF